MSYIEENDLKVYMPTAELTAIKETIGSSDNVAMAIANVCALADTKLLNQYDLPLALTIETLALKSALAKITVWDLSGNYSSLSDVVKEKREKDYNDGMAYLNGLADGSIKLIDTEAVSEADRYAFDSQVRITRDLM